MEPTSHDPSRRLAGAARALPLDPDLDDTAAGGRRAVPIQWWTAAAVGGGGFLGGLARYEVGLGWATSPGAFPWSTFVVNTSGALLLALLLVVAVELLPGVGALRPTLGTGFCGAFTTFSSVTTAVDQLGAHSRLAVAVGYLFASLLAGVAATATGILLGRLLVARAEPRLREPT